MKKNTVKYGKAPKSFLALHRKLSAANRKRLAADARLRKATDEFDRIDTRICDLGFNLAEKAKHHYLKEHPRPSKPKVGDIFRSVSDGEVSDNGVITLNLLYGVYNGMAWCFHTYHTDKPLDTLRKAKNCSKYWVNRSAKEADRGADG